MYSPALTIQIINHIKETGINVDFAIIKNESFLPGIAIQNGGIVIDSEKLKHPGDVLITAGYITAVPAEQRAQINGDSFAGHQDAAIAWANTASKQLGLDSSVVSHPA